jgi:hypothetical protein
MIANQHSRWHLKAHKEKQQVTVDPVFLLERLLWRKYASEFCSHMLEAHAENLIVFDYENLFSDLSSSLDMISSFLNISGNEFTYSQEVKSNPFALSEVVLNYEECLDFFRDKPAYFEMFSETNE